MDNLSLLIIALNQLPKIGRAKIFPFVNGFFFDSSIGVRENLNIFSDNIKSGLIKGIKESFSSDILDKVYNKAEEIASQSKKLGIGIINFKEENFPKLFNSMSKDPPILLYYLGDISKLNKQRNITIIGSRNADNTGLTTSFYLGKQFASKGYNIVSGLAKGCDVEAHKGALSVNGLTTAIVGCGLDSIVTNKDVAKNIYQSGGVIFSEFPVGEKDTKRSLIERDRLQAGVSDIIIGVQFSKESGTTHALNTALENKRKVFVVKYKNNNSELISGNNYYLENTDAEELTSKTIDLI